MDTYKTYHPVELVGHSSPVHPVYTRTISHLYKNCMGKGVEKPGKVPRGQTGRPINLPESSFKNVTVGQTDILLKSNKSRDGNVNYDQHE